MFVDNIYIKALEIGEQNIKEGIKYDEIIKQLNIKDGHPRFIENFRVWFLRTSIMKKLNVICLINIWIIQQHLIICHPF